MTGMAAFGPKLPKPKIAEPSEITATRLFVQVYFGKSAGFSEIAWLTAPTPGL